MSDVLQAELRNDYEFATGSQRVADLGALIDVTITESIDNSDGFVITITDQQLPLLRQRMVIALSDAGGTIVEGRIRQWSHNLTARTVVITCLGPAFDLVECGNLRVHVADHVEYVVGGNYSDPDWIDLFILAETAHYQLTHFARGSITLTGTTALQFDAPITPKVLLDTLVQGRGEWTLLRNTVSRKFEIIMASAIGADAPLLSASFPDTVLDQEDEADAETLYTVAIPSGLTPTDATEPADVRDNVFAVASRTGAGPYRHSLRDPGTGAVLVVEDGQYATATGHALRLPDLTIAAITNSYASDASVEIANPLNVGDRVQLLASTAGELLSEVTLPSRLALYGRKVKTPSYPLRRGERNYVLNPGFASGVANWRLLNSAQLVPYSRDETGDVSGLMNGARTSGGASSLAMDGFPPSMTLRKGMSIDSQGFSFVTSAAYVSTRLGKIDANIVGTLPATILDGSYLANNIGVGVLADGTIGSGASHVPMKNLIPTAHPNAGDKIRITTGSVYGAAVSAVYPEPLLGLTYVFLFGSFGKNLSIADTVHYTEGSGYLADLTLANPYTNGDPYMLVADYPWEGSQFFPANAQVTLDQRVVTEKAVFANVDWGTDLKCTVTLTATVGRSIAPADITAFELITSAGVVRMTGLVLQTALFSSDTTVGLHNPSSANITVVPNGTTFSLPGETFVVATATTLNGSGAGTVPTTAAPTVSIADNAVMIVRRCAEYADIDGGSANLMRLIAVAFNTPPISVDMAAATEGQRVYVRPGSTREVCAHLAYTMWSRAADQTARVQLSLWNSDTNTFIASVLTDPDPIPLTQLSGVTIPVHGHLRCETVLSESTKLELRVNTDATTGIGSAAYKVEVTLRWAMITTGPDTQIPYVDGSPANAMILSEIAALQRDAIATTRHTVTLLEFRQFSNQPALALSALQKGQRCTIETTGEVQRASLITRRPLAPESSSIVFGALPSTLTGQIALQGAA